MTQPASPDHQKTSASGHSHRTSEHFDGQNEGNEGIFVSFSADGLIGHSGADPGVSTYMFFNPKTNTGKIQTFIKILN